MYVWTHKAENDFKAKYPGRKVTRIAGDTVTWEGKVLECGCILDGYIERGWVKNTEKEHCEKAKVKAKHVYRLPNNSMSAAERRRRWGKLLFVFNQPNVCSIQDAATAMGLKSATSINDFVSKYGKELALKYGRLPHLRGVKRSYWFDVMEAGQ